MVNFVNQVFDCWLRPCVMGNVQNKIQLEKFKFVLDYKIKELKRQIEPREKEISDMKNQIEEMDLELSQVWRFMTSEICFDM